MHTLPTHTLLSAITLAALAGCVDAIGFMQLGGFFVSFMSGNSTRLAVGLQRGDWLGVETVFSILGCFVLGAAIGVTVRNHSAVKNRATSVLTIVTALLAVAALCDSSGEHSMSMWIIAIAMGAENFVLLKNGDNVIGVTYMTGTLVKMGQHLATALQSGKGYSWLPYFFSWFGLITGGITGAFLFTEYTFNALWFPTAWALLLTLAMWRS